jgi:hypothetical protein
MFTGWQADKTVAFGAIAEKLLYVNVVCAGAPASVEFTQRPPDFFSHLEHALD